MSYPPYDADDELMAGTEADGRTRFRVYCPAQVAVVLGRGSRAETELYLEACREDGVPILRRRGGGCAVVLDPGNVVVSAAIPVKGLGQVKQEMRRMCQWLLGGLGRLGVPAELAGISDLAIQGRKIAGSCVYRTRTVLFYSATLLVFPDASLMLRYLKHPPREPSYRAQRSHDAFIGRIDLPELDKAADLAEDLQRALEEPKL